MEENVDQSSFASILAGVQQMRESYDDFDGSEQKEQSEGTKSNQTEGQNTDSVQKETASIRKETDIGQDTGSIQKKKDVGQNQVEVAQKEAGLGQDTGRIQKQTGIGQKENISNTGDAQGAIQKPNTPIPARRGPRNVHSYTSVQVAPSQKGNPLLEAPQMKLTPWSYNSQILSDYYINATLQVLFLSLKYHKLRPEYVWRRIDKLKGGSSSTHVHQDDDALRVLLMVVDIDSPQEAIRKLSVICIKNDLTMVVAWSFEEAGNYIAGLKTNEMARSKVNVSIQGVKKTDFNSNIINSLTTVRAVNKTDVANLLANCKSFRNIVVQAKGEGLASIPGLGGRKVANLKDAFYEPFIFNKDYETAL